MHRLAPLWLVLFACVAHPQDTAPPPVQLLEHGIPVQFRDPQVFSISEDNQKFLIVLWVDFSPAPSWDGIELLCGASRLRPTQSGSNDHDGVYAFKSDVLTARTVASSLGLKATDREPFPVKLVGRLEPAPTPPGREPGREPERLLRFTLSNEGVAPAWVNCGERVGPVSGPDSQFMMELEPKERPFLSPPFDPWMEEQDHLRLGPGESRILQLDPTSLCEGLRPGSYKLRATFAAEFYPVDWEYGQGPFGWEQHITHRCSVAADLAIELK